MKNIRYEIIKAVADVGICPRADLCAALGEKITQTQKTDSIAQTVSAGLIERVMDESTKTIAYRATKEGHERLKLGPGKLNGHAENVPIAEPAAEEMPKISIEQVEAALHKAIAERDAWVLMAATAAQTVLHTPKEMFDYIASLRADLATAQSQRNAWRDAIGDISGEDTPENARQYIETLKSKLATRRAENTALKTLNDTMPGFGAAYEAKREQDEQVNHPSHYQGKVECIDAIEAALGPEGFAAYCRGNSLKYTFRAGKKGPAETDLKKAAWYLNRITASKEAS